MHKLKINLFVADDGFQKEYPVTIFDGNIKSDIPNGLPHFEDERVNFKYQYAPTYADISNGKVNTKFIYPFSLRYGKHLEGAFEAYASLNIYQRIKLSFIAKTSIFHLHTKALIFAIINILGFIPLWIPFLFPPGEEFHKSSPPKQKQSIVNSKEATDSSVFAPLDTLQQKEKIK